MFANYQVEYVDVKRQRDVGDISKYVCVILFRLFFHTPRLNACSQPDQIIWAMIECLIEFICLLFIRLTTREGNELKNTMRREPLDRTAMNSGFSKALPKTRCSCRQYFFHLRSPGFAGPEPHSQTARCRFSLGATPPNNWHRLQLALCKKKTEHHDEYIHPYLSCI